MGRDLDAQRAGTLPGAGRVDLGYYDISSGSLTCEVPTVLTSCYFGLGIADMNGDDNNCLVFNTDCSISAGAVTFRRNSGYTAEDVRFRYMLIGW